jgi:hypothetical protein
MIGNSPAIDIIGFNTELIADLGRNFPTTMNEDLGFFDRAKVLKKFFQGSGVIKHISPNFDNE